MATEWFLVCEQCGRSPALGTLFNALRRARDDALQCSQCSKPAKLGLKLGFGLNTPDSEFTVRDCFIPRHLESWLDKDGSNVTFYPFLVILRRHGRELAAWLPYWHTIEKHGRKPAQKFGQWAPCMDFDLFEDLLAQARAKGYLR